MRILASPNLRRNTLALGLCLLAVLFALEAKTAWYAPAYGPGRDIQSQKALPADVPAVISHGTSSHPPAIFPPALVFIAGIAPIARMGAYFLAGNHIDFDQVPVSAAPYFSPSLFFRPPPVL